MSPSSERARSRDHVTTLFPTEYVRTGTVHCSRALEWNTVVTWSPAGMAA